eukprot:scaffold2257_cov291-Prasinococcus_capsulatus_cf.AAC.4
MHPMYVLCCSSLIARPTDMLLRCRARPSAGAWATSYASISRRLSAPRRSLRPSSSRGARPVQPARRMHPMYALCSKTAIAHPIHVLA